MILQYTSDQRLAPCLASAVRYAEPRIFFFGCGGRAPCSPIEGILGCLCNPPNAQSPPPTQLCLRQVQPKHSPTDGPEPSQESRATVWPSCDEGKCLAPDDSSMDAALSKFARPDRLTASLAP